MEAYSTGLFRDNFASAVDLQAKVVAALAKLPELGRTAEWRPLTAPISLEWRGNWTEPRDPESLGAGAQIELHAVPIDPVRLSARQLRDTSESIARRLRALGLVSISAAINVGSDSTAAWALPASPPLRWNWNEPRPEVTLGVRLSASGQRSIWQQLPSDGMGSLLDPEDLPTRVAGLLRLLGQVAPLTETRWALGIGLRPSVTLSVGPLSSLGQRTSALGYP